MNNGSNDGPCVMDSKRSAPPREELFAITSQYMQRCVIASWSAKRQYSRVRDILSININMIK